MSKYEGFVFAGLRIPCHIYENGRFSFEDILCRYRATFDPGSPDPEHPYLTRELIGVREHLVEQRRKEAEERGAPFFDGRLVRLEDYGVQFVDDEDRKVLIVTFGPTTWFTYNATNKSLDTGEVSGKSGSKTIREEYVEDPLALDDNLGNATGVSTTLISVPDGKLVYVERSKQLSQYPELFGDAAAGFMSREKDSTVSGVPNPFYTIAREMEEEMGIPCSPEDFVLLGVGRAMDDLHGEIWTELRTKYKVEEILSFPKSHKYEHLRIITIPFEPKEVAELFKEQLIPEEWFEKMKMWIDPEEYPSVPKWVPAHAVNTIQSLVHEYGYDIVRKAFEKELRPARRHSGENCK
jgi:8-oxo-dGTP pyrophosphatase MutT (NUDIX family)